MTSSKSDNIKCSWAMSFAMDVPHFEVNFFQIPDPLCGVEQGAGEPYILQLLPEIQPLSMVQA